MSFDLYFDPGLHKAGLCIVMDKRLLWCGTVINPVPGRGPATWLGMARAVVDIFLKVTHRHTVSVNVLVMEVMQSYTGANKAARDEDLMELMGVNGCVMGLIQPTKVLAYLPRTWKGQVPKTVMHTRIRTKRLTRAELSLMPPPAQHDAWDACGLWLYTIGRLHGG